MFRDKFDNTALPLVNGAPCEAFSRQLDRPAMEQHGCFLCVAYASSSDGSGPLAAVVGSGFWWESAWVDLLMGLQDHAEECPDLLAVAEELHESIRIFL